MSLNVKIEQVTGYQNRKLDGYVKRMEEIKERYKAINSELKESMIAERNERTKLLKFWAKKGF